MVTVQGVSKSFGPVVALKDVSFEARAGEILGLVGENGAGKSTLLRIISTLLTPSAGTVMVDGLKAGADDMKIRGRMGVLFGNETGLNDRMTARENIVYYAMLHELPKAQIVARVDYLITEFHLEPFIDKLARKLSKGMKQKVAIARAIVHDPSIILFDEPEAGLDFCAAKRTFDFLLKCRNEGKTVIFCSHSLKSIREFSNRLIVLNHGVLVNTLEMDELRAAHSNKEMNKLLLDLVKKRAG